MLSPEKILRILNEDCGYRKGDSIVAGVSGGADSVALLHLLQAAGVPVAAAHVNYGLRAEESDGDEQFVSELCAKLNVPLYTRRTNREELAALDNNLQSAARIIRVNFLIEISKKESVTFRALAHNANDQLETLLINFLRGSGFTGMDGMYKRTNAFIRPLLDFTREEILTYLQSQTQEWREDSSNQSDAYLRNRIRHHLIPVIEELDQRNGKGIIKSIDRLNDSHFLLRDLVQWFADDIVHESNGKVVISKSKLAASPSPRLLLNYFLKKYNTNIHFGIDAFDELMLQQAGKKYQVESSELVVDRDMFIVQRIGHLAFNEFYLAPPSQINGWTTSFITATDPKMYSGYEAVVDGSIASELYVRTWVEGDAIQPLGFGGTKKVSDVLTEMKVPSHEKQHYPVLVYDTQVVWIPGYRIAEKFKITDTGKPALHIRWNR